MSNQSTALAIATAKEMCLDAWKNQMLMSISPFYNKIKKSYTPSKDFKTAAPVGQVGGYAFTGEDGALPTAGALGYIQFAGSVKNIMVPIRITDKAIEASKNKAGSLVGNLFVNEVENAFSTAKINLSRAIVAGNGTGILATVTDNEDSTTVTASNHRYLDLGMTIDVYQSNGTLIGTRRITGLVRNSDGTGTLTVDSTIDTLAATSYITIQKSLNNEITGIDALFNSGVTTYMGLTKSEHPEIVPISNDASGDITNSKIRKIITESDNYHGGETDMILCGDDAFAAYSDFLDVMKIPMQTNELVGGFTAIKFLHGNRTIDVVCEKFVDPTEMIGLNTKDFEEMYLTDWGYMEQEDSGKLERVAGTDYYETVIRKYAELVCKKPGACWKLTNCA